MGINDVVVQWFGEVIDDIGAHIDETRTKTDEARQQLELTVDWHARRRCRCGLIALSILVLAIVLLVVLLIIFNGKKSGGHSIMVQYIVVCSMAGLPISCKGGIAAS